MNDGGFALEMACMFLLIIVSAFAILFFYGLFKFSKWVYNKRKVKSWFQLKTFMNFDSYENCKS